MYNNNAPKITHCSILIYDISDHLPIYFEVNSSKIKNNNKNNSCVFCNMKKFNPKVFVVDISLASENYITLIDNHSLYYAFSNFIDHFKQVINKHALLHYATRK